MDIHISFVPETIFDISGIAITNSMIMAVVTAIFLTFFLVVGSYRLSSFNPGKLQLMIEVIYEVLWGMAKDILGEKHVHKYFGFLLTFFVFILASNYSGLLPIVPGIGIVEDPQKINNIEFIEILKAKESTNKAEIETDKNILCLVSGSCLLSNKGIIENESFAPIFRAPSADLSMTIALAIISVVVTNAVGIVVRGPMFLKRYIDFSSGISAIVGILELISEIGKIISFAFRLFGNIFAGEVLLSVLTALTFGVATLPFLGLEIFVGAIQAFVFFMLTAVFLSLAMESH